MWKSADKVSISVAAPPAFFSVWLLRRKKLTVVRAVVVVELMSAELRPRAAKNALTV